MNIRIPLFVRDEYMKVLNENILSMDKSIIDDGFVRVYSTPSCLPIHTVGIVTSIHLDADNSYIEFNVAECTSDGRIVKRFYDAGIQQFASAIFQWNTCDIIDAYLIGFSVHSLSSKLTGDEEFEKFAEKLKKNAFGGKDELEET